MAYFFVTLVTKKQTIFLILMMQDAGMAPCALADALGNALVIGNALNFRVKTRSMTRNEPSVGWRVFNNYCKDKQIDNGFI